MNDAKHIIGKIEFGPATSGLVRTKGADSDSLRLLQEENKRLKQTLEQIGRMRCHPDKAINLATLSAAIQMAQAALGDRA